MRLLLAAGALFATDLLLAVVLPARSADAGTAVRLDLPALVQGSDLIVEARVLAARPSESGPWLATEYLLEVARTFKGADRVHQAVRLPGGVRADGSGLLVAGVPRLAAGEEVLLFLGPESRDGLRVPTGLAQGKLTLRRTADGQKYLARDLSALCLSSPGLAGAGRADGGTRALLDYAEVVAGIEAAAAGAGR